MDVVGPSRRVMKQEVISSPSKLSTATELRNAWMILDAIWMRDQMTFSKQKSFDNSDLTSNLLNQFGCFAKHSEWANQWESAPINPFPVATAYGSRPMESRLSGCVPEKANVRIEMSGISKWTLKSLKTFLFQSLIRAFIDDIWDFQKKWEVITSKLPVVVRV